MLIKSAARRARCSTPFEVMDVLGISVKQIKGKNFWYANEHELPGIYSEFCREVRRKLRELHPDTGGDGHAFGEFRSASNRVRKVFEKKGFGRDLALERALRAQSEFEQRIASRITGPLFREYDEDDEIDLSLWKMGVYDRIIQAGERMETKPLPFTGEARYRVPFDRHPPYLFRP